MKLCETIDDLKNIDDICQEKREDRILERNYLFSIFNDIPNHIKAIIHNIVI